MKPHDTVLIWTGEHRAWWRPQGMGYTDDRDEAGRWFFDDALATVRHCGRDKHISFEMARIDTVSVPVNPVRIPLEKVIMEGAK
jgi:hypothetical protein